MNKQREKVKTYNIYSAYDKRYIRESKKGKKQNEKGNAPDMPKMEQLDLFGGEPTPIHTKREWLEAFRKHCDEIYKREGNKSGAYYCGYYWCCDKCKCELADGCADCVATITSILEENGVEIDYSDFDFDYWERKAKELS